MPPRTIDNLGADVSTRYAEDQRQLDTDLISSSRGIQAQTEIDVTSPAYPSELDALLQNQPTQNTWGSFEAPKGYQDQKKRIFTAAGLIPSLGSEEKQESLAQKVTTKLRTLLEKRKEPSTSGREKWQEDKDIEDQEKAKNTFTKLFTTVTDLNKIVVAVNSLRGQYHKG